MSIHSELDHLAMPIHLLAQGKKNQLAQAMIEPGTFRPTVKRSAVAPHWQGAPIFYF